MKSNPPIYAAHRGHRPGRILRWSFGIVAALCLFSSAWAQRIAFINPGKHDELYWATATSSMQAAAQSLGMQLEVHYAERDHIQMVELVRRIAERPPSKRPEYIVLVNERRMGAAMLKLATAAGIKSLFAFNTLLADDRRDIGAPRSQHPLWLGSIVPHAEDAGYLTAKALIARGLKERRFDDDGKLHMIAIAGDRSTESSLLRNRGMERAVRESPLVVLDQIVYADWQRDAARVMAKELFRRYPKSALVWAGSDVMAFGAMEALTEAGQQPGTDRWFSGVNTSTEALNAVIDGRLEALAGGHFMAGAWAMVLIYDHAHDRDFSNEGLELDRPMFALFDAALAKSFMRRFGSDDPKLDFRTFTKSLNPKRKIYDFDFTSFL